MTPEEYVVDRAIKLEEENSKLREGIEIFRKTANEANKARVEAERKLEALKELLMKHAAFKTTSCGTEYIDIETFWKRNYNAKDRADFDFISEFLEINEDFFEPYIEPVIEKKEEKESKDGDE